METFNEGEYNIKIFFKWSYKTFANYIVAYNGEFIEIRLIMIEMSQNQHG